MPHYSLLSESRNIDPQEPLVVCTVSCGDMDPLGRPPETESRFSDRISWIGLGIRP